MREKNVCIDTDTHTSPLPPQNPSQGMSLERFWGQMLMLLLTEQIMMLLPALRYCTLYDNRPEKASLKVVIMRTSRRTYYRLRSCKGIIILMEQAELHIQVDGILPLLRILLNYTICDLGYVL